MNGNFVVKICVIFAVVCWVVVFAATVALSFFIPYE